MFKISGSKPVVVRKIIRNGQPEEAEGKKDVLKPAETKVQKVEVVESEENKERKNKLVPSVKPKVLLQNLFFFFLLHSRQICIQSYF